ncbi:hypothetical protein Q3V30_16735 [Erwinia pyri]|uniref:Uncharacterized protein n=1 Tax=Erwinia pyri TaxID=3062598 RepID=A0AA50HM27_9GAMM|nr:hypothetical protein [Erwinia sp. DE2]WLS78097.1 hypothetical protein Q3V30_16735 [Erwinia sp. DE2]
MFKLLFSLFSSPEALLQVMSQRDIEESIEEGERILIDEDGGATVNIASAEVHQDFARHVNALKRA